MSDGQTILLYEHDQSSNGTQSNIKEKIEDSDKPVIKYKQDINSNLDHSNLDIIGISSNSSGNGDKNDYNKSLSVSQGQNADSNLENGSSEAKGESDKNIHKSSILEITENSSEEIEDDQSLNPYRCEICSIDYPSIKFLKNHVKKPKHLMALSMVRRGRKVNQPVCKWKNPDKVHKVSKEILETTRIKYIYDQLGRDGTKHLNTMTDQKGSQAQPQNLNKPSISTHQSQTFSPGSSNLRPQMQSLSLNSPLKNVHQPQAFYLSSPNPQESTQRQSQGSGWTNYCIQPSMPFIPYNPNNFYQPPLQFPNVPVNGQLMQPQHFNHFFNSIFAQQQPFVGTNLSLPSTNPQSTNSIKAGMKRSHTFNPGPSNFQPKMMSPNVHSTGKSSHESPKRMQVIQNPGTSRQLSNAVDPSISFRPPQLQPQILSFPVTINQMPQSPAKNMTPYLIPEFDCHICNKTFGTQIYLDLHKTDVHSDWNHKCLICNKRFFTKELLDAHKVNSKHDMAK